MDIEENFKEVMKLNVINECLWHVQFYGAQGSLYQGEQFTL